MQAVRKDCNALEFTSPAFRGDRDVVLGATSGKIMEAGPSGTPLTMERSRRRDAGHLHVGFGEGDLASFLRGSNTTRKNASTKPETPSRSCQKGGFHPMGRKPPMPGRSRCTGTSPRSICKRTSCFKEDGSRTGLGGTPFERLHAAVGAARIPKRARNSSCDGVPNGSQCTETCVGLP